MTDFSDSIQTQIKKLEDDQLFKNILDPKNSTKLRSISFMEVPFVLNLQDNSQPFIADLNGDLIDDILFNTDTKL